ncbi:XRE family transcriptional regulator [Streptosporangium nondiastaticum]|uniref:XRE family transcriptional regulator n=1 Tax=Streptosporangium nondiastaticum TaxID=35764 RepID=A0A9X7PI30_9ACTN|nr:helix-turn-helix transcriptional regulator [Streptosporangium nondiastaticum]PSJ28750.1 XRE family transcriptional regulator [Streptosporangium nondiastaticum]
MGEVFLPGNHRYFGKQFMMWRQEAEMSREEVAEAVGYSAEMVRSVEQGRRACPPRMAEIADELFGARGKLKDGLSYLTREKYPARSRDFMQREAEAVAHSSYESTLIPGLLQTEAYARALLGGTWPPADDEVVERRLEVRMARQERLHRKPMLSFNFIIYEAALRCPMGGPEAHKGQLLHLIDAAKLPNVILQVLPFENAVSSALGGAMVLLEMPEYKRVAYVMGQSMSELADDPAEVNRLEQRFRRLSAQALSPNDTVRSIERMVETL